jgi:hypothetical protein
MKLRKLGLSGAAALTIATMAGTADAQLRDITQISPSVPGGHINKSFAQEIGDGVGTINTPNTSAFIIARDPFRAVRRGRQLFQRKFTLSQGVGPTTNDGVGNPSFVGGDPSITAGLADSCAACHGRPRGSAGAGGDVVTRPDSRDAPHLFGLGLQEQLADEMTSLLRGIRDGAADEAATIFNDTGMTGVVTRPLVAKGVSFGSITATFDGSSPTAAINTSAVVGVNPDLRIRPFFAQGGTISIREFLVGAFNAEMGLESPDELLLAAAAGGIRTTPAGMTLNGVTDAIEGPPVATTTGDPDNDGHVNEIPQSIADFMEFYLLHYFKAATGEQSPTVLSGRSLFTMIGCTSCHRPTFTITRDRRIADLETVFDPAQGNPFNRLFATPAAFVEGGLGGVSDGTGLPNLKQATEHSFVVRNFFADFKRHSLGSNFDERLYEGRTTMPEHFTTQFITEPLWGVGTTAPYGHDGRSNTLEDVILRHGGEAAASQAAFAALNASQRNTIIQFLQSLILFAPDDTASGLQPKDVAAFNFPQNGHGAIALTPLFNNTADLE